MNTRCIVLTMAMTVVMLAVAAPTGILAESGVDTRATFVECAFYVDGFGCLQAGPHSISSGSLTAMFSLGESIKLYAVPAQGWQFSHWSFNGSHGGNSPFSRVTASKDLYVEAHFIRK